MTESSIPTRLDSYSSILAIRGFRTVFAVHVLRVLSENVAVLALAALVFQETGAATISAVAFVAGMVPQAIGGVFLSGLADRLSGRSVLGCILLLRAVPAVLVGLDSISAVAAIIVFGALGFLTPVANATIHGSVPSLVGRGDGFILARSLLTTSLGVVQVAGHLLVGMLLALGSNGQAAMLLSAATSLAACALSIRSFPKCLGEARLSVGATLSSIPSSSAAAWAILRRRRSFKILLGIWLPFGVAVGAEGLIVPYADDIGASYAAGFLLAAVAAGMVTGNLMVGRFMCPATRAKAVPFCIVLLGFPAVAVLGFSWWITCAALFLCGLGLSYELVLQRSYIETVSGSSDGVAFGLMTTGLITSQSLGIVLAGGLGDLTSPAVGIGACGATAVLLGILLLRDQGASIRESEDATE